jgi:hypothetical protein
MSTIEQKKRKHKTHEILKQHNQEKQIKIYNINENFYKDYLIAETPKYNTPLQIENNFQARMTARIQHIRDIYHFTKEKWTDEIIINKYFSKIFSQAIITKEMLDEISNILYSNRIFVLLDPCCGNGFHMYLFRTFTRFCVVGIDINPEPCAWLDILAGITIGKPHDPAFNSLEVLTDVFEMYNTRKGCTQDYMCLFLSYIDVDDLAHELLNIFQGNFVIMIGNPKEKFPDTFKHLEEEFNVLNVFKIKQHDGTLDTLEIYRRKNINIFTNKKILTTDP